MNKQIALTEAKCTRLTIDAPVTFLAADGSEEKTDFQIEAYTGAVVDRWWGRLAIDIDGIKAKQRMPILRDHMARDIVGYSLKCWKKKSFFVSGRFSKSTETAKEVQALADEGFPWQASIGVKALQVLEVKQGGSMEVNGVQVMGPAEVWTESEVYETSFTPTAADGDTTVTRFSKFEEAAPGAAGNLNNGGRLMEITLEVLEKEAPELLQQIRETAAAGVNTEETRREGGDAERARILELAKVQFGDQLGAAFEEIVKTGVTVEQFKAIRGTAPKPPDGADTLARVKEHLLNAIETAGAGDPGGGDSTSTGGQGDKDFLTLVADHQAQHGCGKVEAMKAIRGQHPEKHKAYIAGMN